MAATEGRVIEMAEETEMEIQGIVAAVVRTMDETYGARVAEVEAGVAELHNWLSEWAPGVNEAVAAHATSLGVTQEAIVRMLSGGAGVDSDGWRAFVLGEAVRLGIGPGEMVRARKAEETEGEGVDEDAADSEGL